MKTVVHRLTEPERLKLQKRLREVMQHTSKKDLARSCRMPGGANHMYKHTETPGAPISIEAVMAWARAFGWTISEVCESAGRQIDEAAAMNRRPLTVTALAVELERLLPRIDVKNRVELATVILGPVDGITAESITTAIGDKLTPL